MKDNILKSNNIISKIILFLGCAIRIFFCINASPTMYQHDVMMDGGHFHYACHFFSTLSLPNSRYGEFYQPPLNSFINAIWMKVMAIFIKPSTMVSKLLNEYVSGNYKLLFSNKSLENYMLRLFATTKVLSIIYSVTILYLIYKIVENKGDGDNYCSGSDNHIFKSVVLGICAFYPGMILMATQYSNDGLSYMFFFLSLYLAIKWFKNNDIKTIIALAISIGLGMMTKISVGTVAFIIAPMMLYRLFTTNDGNVYVSGIDEKKIKFSFNTKIFKELIIFSIIVFPLGLLFPIRNAIVFNQSLTYVRPLSANNPLYTGDYSLYDRVFSFPFSRLFDTKSFIYHDIKEYNIWIDLIKTSTFDEVSGAGRFVISHFIIYILNIMFYILSIFAFIYGIIKNVKNKFKSFIIYDYIGFMLIILSLIMYIMFNIKYPASCSSNYRYILYITFGNALVISNLFNKIIKKKNLYDEK